MNKELKEKTIDLAKKVATNTGTYSERRKITSMKNDIKNTYYDIFQSKLKNNTKNIVSYRKNLQAFSSVKANNLFNEIDNIDKATLLTDTENALEGINSRYNDNWLKSETDIIISRQLNDYNFDNYLSAQVDSPNVMVVWKCSVDNVCDDCEELDGTALPPDDPFWDENCPGEIHPNCRCYTELDYDTEKTLETPETEKNKTVAPRSSGNIFNIGQENE